MGQIIENVLRNDSENSLVVSTELYELLLHFLLGRDCNKQRSLLNERTIDVITTSNFLV